MPKAKSWKNHHPAPGRRTLYVRNFPDKLRDRVQQLAARRLMQPNEMFIHLLVLGLEADKDTQAHPPAQP